MECNEPSPIAKRPGLEQRSVRVLRGDKREYRCLTWSEIERAEANPILQLIDETIAAASGA
jgi:hypothetical protein